MAKKDSNLSAKGTARRKASASRLPDSERKNKGAPKWLKEKKREEHSGVTDTRKELDKPTEARLGRAKRDSRTDVTAERGAMKSSTDRRLTEVTCEVNTDSIRHSGNEDGRTELSAGALLAPVPPAIVTVSDGERTNALTVGWCGILSTIPPRTYISVRPSRYSYPILKANGEFVINLASSDMAAAVDLIGIYTGAKMDKLKAAGLGTLPSKSVLPPTIKECPIALECRVCEVKEMGSHDVFIADIVNVTCQNSLIDEKGKLHYELADLLAYAHGEYFALGERVGKFGFSTDKEEKRARISRTRKEKEK